MKKTIDLDEVLDIKIESRDIGDTTLRGYLRQLLLTLWIEEEGFSGKRPFGNSGWQGDVEIALIKNGYVEGKIDKDEGWLEEVNVAQVKASMLKVIKHMCKEKDNEQH